MKKRGFTLIELLIVIGLIALLLAMLVPSLAQARKLAARVHCSGTLKTIGLAIHSYHDDNDAWPRRTDVTRPFEWDKAMYDQLLSRYLMDPSVLYCKDNSEDIVPPGTSWPVPDPAATGPLGRLGYVFLDGMPGAADPRDTTGWQARAYHKTRTWDTSSRTWSAWTEDSPFPLYRPNLSLSWAQNPPMVGDIVYQQASPDNWIINHMNKPNANPQGMNCLFADGHAEWLTEDADPNNTYDSNTQKLRRWMQIWTGPKGEALMWLWASTDVSQAEN